MKKIKFIAATLLMGFVTVSCTDVLEDNVNPDRAHVIDAKVGLPVLPVAVSGVIVITD